LQILLFVPAEADAAMRELRILASSRIIPPAVVQRFEAKYDIRVRFEYFESPEALAAYLESRPNEDMALVRGHYLDDLKKSKQVAMLDHSLLPNLQYMDRTYLESQPDPGAQYSIPYMVGNIGLIYRSDLLGHNPPNLSQLFEPNSLVVPFSIMRQYRDAIGVALKYLGYSYNSTTLIQIEDAVTLLKSLNERPTFIGFMQNDAARRFLKEGVTYMALSYNNEAARAIADDPRLAYVTLSDTLIGWSYAHVISDRSEHLAEAHTWLNYLMEPEVAAEISAWNLATSPNLAARDLMPESVRDNPVLYPEGGVWHGAEIPGSVDDASKTYIEYWYHL
jgi:spermidine/putrescine transport system substrate-binding protein